MGKRGKARADRQIGDLQVPILLWLRSQLRKTKHDPWWSRIERATKKARRTDPAITELVLIPVDERGVRWNVKRFYDNPKPTRSQESTLSKARKALEERGLIACHKAGNRTTHAKLTKLGWETAEHWARHGLSEREMRTVTTDTPASVRHAELTREVIDRQDALRYAEGIGDKQLEAKLLAEIAERKRELGLLAASVERARAEAVVRDYPDSPLAERFRGMLKHPDFFEHVAALNARANM